MEEKIKYIWGCDLSLSNTGITILNAKDGSHIFTTSIDTKSEVNTQMKLRKIGVELLKLKDEYWPDVIVIENGFTRFNISTQQLYRCHGLVNYLFWDIKQVYYASTTIKKVLTQKGNSPKDKVRDIVMLNFPNLKINNLDESDSVGIVMVWMIENGIGVWKYE